MVVAEGSAEHARGGKPYQPYQPYRPSSGPVRLVTAVRLKPYRSRCRRAAGASRRERLGTA